MEIFAMLWTILENIVTLLNFCKFWKILDKYEIYFPKKRANCDPGRGTGAGTLQLNNRRLIGCLQSATR